MVNPKVCMQVGGLIIDFGNCTPDKCSNYDLCDPFYKKKLSDTVELPPTMQSLLQKRRKVATGGQRNG